MTSVCNSPFCQGLDLQRTREVDLANRLRELETLAIGHAQHVRPELSAKSSLTTIVLPFLEHNLTTPSLERKQRVEAGFLKVALEAYATVEHVQPHSKTDDGEQNDLPQNIPYLETQPVELTCADEQLSSRFSKLNGSACGTCGGWCCHRCGGDSAFLDIEKFVEIFQSRPDATPETIVAEYIARIPDETFEGSCIFHGIHGCTLPREERAGICNRYLCPSLERLKGHVQNGSTEFLLAATNLREEENSQPNVLRCKIVDDHEETILVSAPNDRIPIAR